MWQGILPASAVRESHIRLDNKLFFMDNSELQYFCELHISIEKTKEYARLYDVGISDIDIGEVSKEDSEIVVRHILNRQSQVDLNNFEIISKVPSYNGTTHKFIIEVPDASTENDLCEFLLSCTYFYHTGPVNNYWD